MIDKDLSKHLKEAREFVHETMKMARDKDLEISKATAVFKGATTMVQLGKLELDVAKFK